jgi:hypothetical protein
MKLFMLQSFQEICMEEYVFAVNCTGELMHFDFVMNKSTASG